MHKETERDRQSDRLRDYLIDNTIFFSGSNTKPWPLHQLLVLVLIFVEPSFVRQANFITLHIPPFHSSIHSQNVTLNIFDYLKSFHTSFNHRFDVINLASNL